MEPSPKRRCLDSSPSTYPPAEYSVPQHDIYSQQEYHQSSEVLRAKLKYRFEDIFSKYERDFTDVGDEIDLMTGKIIVDNGHLQHMRDEQDEHGRGPEGDEESIDSFVDDTDEDIHVQEPRAPSQRNISIARSPTPDPYSILDRPPINPKWAAPEIPGLSRLPLADLKLNIAGAELENDFDQLKAPKQSIWAVQKDPFSRRQRLLWTFEELQLLRDLKNRDRDWTYPQLQQFFPHRGLTSIRARWMNLCKGESHTFVQNGGEMSVLEGPATNLIGQLYKEQELNLSQSPSKQENLYSDSSALKVVRGSSEPDPDSDMDELAQSSPLSKLSCSRRVAVKNCSSTDRRECNSVHTREKNNPSGLVASTNLTRKPFRKNEALRDTPKEAYAKQRPSSPAQASPLMNFQGQGSEEMKSESKDQPRRSSVGGPKTLLGVFIVDSTPLKPSSTATSVSNKRLLPALDHSALAGGMNLPLRPSTGSTGFTTTEHEAYSTVRSNEHYRESRSMGTDLVSSPSQRSVHVPKKHSPFKAPQPRDRMVSQTLTPTTTQSLLLLGDDSDEGLLPGIAALAATRKASFNSKIASNRSPMSERRAKCGKGFSCKRSICLRCSN